MNSSYSGFYCNTLNVRLICGVITQLKCTPKWKAQLKCTLSAIFDFFEGRSTIWNNDWITQTVNNISRPKYEPLKEKVLASTSENKKSIQLLVDQCLDKIENGSTIQCANGLQTISQSSKIDSTAL